MAISVLAKSLSKMTFTVVIDLYRHDVAIRRYLKQLIAIGNGKQESSQKLSKSESRLAAKIFAIRHQYSYKKYFNVIFNRENGKCAYCGITTVITTQMTNNKATLDHVVCQSQTVTSIAEWLSFQIVENLLLACWQCNNSRKAQNFLTFASQETITYFLTITNDLVKNKLGIKN